MTISNWPLALQAIALIIIWTVLTVASSTAYLMVLMRLARLPNDSRSKYFMEETCLGFALLSLLVLTVHILQSPYMLIWGSWEKLMSSSMLQHAKKYWMKAATFCGISP